MTVALPVLNGGPLLSEVLRAVRDQVVDGDVELLVADSGSTDGSVELARECGAEVFHVERFSHGGTRNLLMERARGSRVALITQDAMPADERWLGRLLGGFDRAEDVGLVYGPYLPRPDASPMVRRELNELFGRLGRDGPRIDRSSEGPDDAGFFTSANCCIAREAWERVPFRDVAYAEDRLVAQEMLGAGLAKVFEPEAAVVHSHDYPPVDRFRRWFDEWRGLREVYGHVEPLGPRRAAALVKRGVRGDLALARSEGAEGGRLVRLGLASFGYHAGRWAAIVTGSRADRLPPAFRRRLSLEGRDTFEPVP